ncbi:MAG: P-II family nitrogen regulator [Candidatus Latescibacterota bacterium]|nr:MAG: P-II family nitrogen regulator [Candidatus Latescibacterota bacterium]RKY71154.1 MAG: P-II family nitrogen regulator [Candidatus Latescibacterota bacterium]HDN67686.1 P-II family nitrogen regulator [Bacillota bacterium]
MLKKIECFIQPFKLEEIKDALVESGVEGMSVTEAKGFGKQHGFVEGEMHNRKVKFRLKTKLEIVVDEELVEKVISVIQRLAYTGTIGSGKIFVVPVEDAIRIRTRETGKSALY